MASKIPETGNFPFIISGADPGEVKWVNFHPPPPFFFLNHADAQTSNTSTRLWLYYIITKIHPPFQNPGSAPAYGLIVIALISGSSGLCSSPGQGHMLCCWARHLTLAVHLPTQVYKWVLENLLLGVTFRWTSIPSRAE